MPKHWIVLPGGREISSGSTGAAILELRLTSSVNREEALTLGSACAAMVEMTLIGVEPEEIGYGQELWLYRQAEEGTRQSMGCFIAEEPMRRGQLLELTAYDRMVKLDRDVSGWLASLDSWPYPLQEFAGMVCQACDLTMTGGSFPTATSLCSGFPVRGSPDGSSSDGWERQPADFAVPPPKDRWSLHGTPRQRRLPLAQVHRVCI